MTKSTLKLSAAGGLMLALSLVVPGAALAQTPPPEPVGTTNTTTTTNAGPGPGAGLGVGAAAFLGGLSGLSVVYDMSRFHIEGIFGFTSLDTGADTTTQFEFGARGWYHVHTGVNSDFSLGGGLGFANNNGGDGPSASAVLIEPGAQARLFLAPNFALAGTVGLTMIFGDSVTGSTTGIQMGGQLLAGLGFNYFFR